jgi:hypothetical protein
MKRGRSQALLGAEPHNALPVRLLTLNYRLPIPPPICPAGLCHGLVHHRRGVRAGLARADDEGPTPRLKLAAAPSALAGLAGPLPPRSAGAQKKAWAAGGGVPGGGLRWPGGQVDGWGGGCPGRRSCWGRRRAGGAAQMPKLDAGPLTQRTGQRSAKLIRRRRTLPLVLGWRFVINHAVR